MELLFSEGWKCVITMIKTWVRMISHLLCLRINSSSQRWLIQQKHFVGEFFMSEVVRAFAGGVRIAAEIVWELSRVDFSDNGILETLIQLYVIKVSPHICLSPFERPFNFFFLKTIKEAALKYFIWHESLDFSTKRRLPKFLPVFWYFTLWIELCL